MSSIKTTQVDGDISIGRNVALGGGALTQGNTHIKGDLTVDGWLYAKNILGKIFNEDGTEYGKFEGAIRGLVKFLDGIEIGNYIEGLSGAKIDADGNAEFGSLVTRLKAILAELQVNGNAEFRGNLSSEEFVSGFLTGKGWAITKKEVLNALGIPETKYTAEIDNMIVRGTLRVYEMIISQLLGENDNRVFTGMMEVDHYDAATGRVYLDTQDGKMYNPFRKDDYIMVQRYNGMPTEENNYYITKHYELLITAAGCGNLDDGEERLDWVEFKNFVSADSLDAADVITKGDTFVRVDNASDPDRKGLIQVITVGSNTPYLDVVYGMKTDPDNSLKGRLGNLQGIYHRLFGWLQGFGAYLANLYAVGDFRLRQTGENLDSQVTMTKNLFATQYKNLRYEMTEEDNYLYNAAFDETMDGWTTDDEGTVITSNDEALLMNGNIYISDGKIACIEQVDGRNVLHLKDSCVRQANSLIKKPGTHKEYIAPEEGDTDNTGEYKEVKDTLYLSLRFLAQTGGTLTIGMDGSTPDIGSLPAPGVEEITSSLEWQEYQASGTWDGTGDFVLEYTGEMYVSVLSLTDKPLEEYKKETSTRIEQTSEYIRMTAERVTNNEAAISELKITATSITEAVGKAATKEELEKNKETLSKSIDDSLTEAKTYTDGVGTGIRDDYDSTVTMVKTSAKGWGVASAAFNADGTIKESAGAVITSKFAGLYAKAVENDTTIQKKSEMKVYVQKDGDGYISNADIKADRIHLEGLVTANENFQIDTKGNMTAKNGTFTGTVNATDGTFTGTVNATSGKIAGFKISGEGLTNEGFNNDAYIVYRNDTANTYAGIGGNILPASSGARAVARFENREANNTAAGGTNYAMLLKTKGGHDNVAIDIDGGSISGFAMKNTLVNKTTQLGRDDYNVLTINTSDITLTLPTMMTYDDGHVIRIKRMGSGGVKIGLAYCNTWDMDATSKTYLTERWSMPVLVHDRCALMIPGNTLEINAVCDAMELVWCRDLSYTVNGTKYYGAWVQYILPRDW